MSKKVQDVENATHNNNPQEKTNSRKFFLWFTIIAIGVVLLCIGYGLVMYECDVLKDAKKEFHNAVNDYIKFKNKSNRR